MLNPLCRIPGGSLQPCFRKIRIHPLKGMCRMFASTGLTQSHDNPLGIPGTKPSVNSSKQRPQPNPVQGQPPQLPRMQRGLPTKRDIPQVKQVVLISSAKGGVGKSTTAVNLALALSRHKQRVGILDADIFGPSLPQLMNLYDEPAVSEQGGYLRPLVNYGVQCMSMGFLVDKEAPIAWRGLMVMKAIQQLLFQVAWDPLDILIVDMPPGTGDVQLSISQLVSVAGAVIITTPQELSLLDARRGVSMFQKVNIPILGLVQNMNQFICPHCHQGSAIFGPDHGEEKAQKMGIPYLGQIPLEPAICSGADQGIPVVISQPDGPHTQRYIDLAERVLQGLTNKPR
ncbi:hypothetical protein IWQ61_010104 [Dispira simplex]|nr:hypothetical protein IWQ61_010104 [Dispira simplex]